MKRWLVACAAVTLAAAGLIAIVSVAARPLLHPTARESPRASDGRRYLVPVPTARFRGITEPWRVGIQAGHWLIDQLPEEQYRLRGSTGTRWKSVTEVSVNHAIAERVTRQLREAGITVDLLPATVPPGYEADAFVAIHADDGGGGDASGWKIASPWRSSTASRKLRDSIASSYAGASGLPEDRYGTTFNMRGYYAFSWTRFEHAVAPTTPAAIIETGFLTSATDRKLIVDDPERAARGISMGILAFLGELRGMPLEALVPLGYPPMEVVTENAPLRYFPDSAEKVRARLSPGTLVRAVDEANGWTELVVWGNYRVFGWVKSSDLRPLSAGAPS
jgi:N-acetylmuramoyl-L-alanine amidase